MSRQLALICHDVATVLRAMRRRPFVPLIAATMLALGIGANIAVFTVLSRTLLRPLRYQQPGQLLAIITSHIQPDHTEVDEPSNDLEFVQWKTRSTVFSDVEAVKPLGMTLSGSGDPDSVKGAFVSGGIFRLFGVRPAFGHDFAREDDVPNARVAIITYGLWQRRFGANANAVGRTMFIDGKPYSVIGVMPRDFEIPLITADLFIPEGLSPANMPNQKSWNYTVFGRMRQGASPKQGQTELRKISKNLEKEFAGSEANKSAKVKSLRDAAYGDHRTALLILSVAVLLVQVLACVNVANLLLAQINDQRGVTALRLTLGANRWQLIRVRFLEGLIIAVAGAIAGYGLAAAAVRLLVGNQPDLAAAVESPWTILAFVVAAVAFSTIIVSFVPALRESRTSLSAILNEGSQRASSSVQGTRARELFVITQVALAVPLLLGATLALNRFRDLSKVDLGFEPNHVLAAQIIMPPKYDKPARAAFVRELLHRIQVIPGVTAAAVTTNLWNRGQSAGTFAATDRNPEFVSMAMRRITPTYFQTMRTSLHRGRAFTDQDVLDAPPVAIVSEALASRFWPGADAIGKRIHRNAPNPWMTIVGIAPDVHDEGIANEVGPCLYVPYLQNNGIYVSLVVRTKDDPLTVRGQVRRAVWSLDRNITPFDEKPLRQFVAATIDPERLQATLLSAFATVALILATVGIYAITAYSVSQRMREIGVRLAFGATPRTISAEVVRQAGRCVAIGLAAGLLIAYIAEHVQMFVAYGAVAFGFRQAVTIAATLFVTSLVASIIPSLRARYVTPSALLRDA